MSHQPKPNDTQIGGFDRMITKQELTKNNKIIDLIDVFVRLITVIWVFVFNFYSLIWLMRLCMWATDNTTIYDWHFPVIFSLPIIFIIPLIISILFIAALAGIYNIQPIGRFLSGFTFIIALYLLAGAIITYSSILDLTVDIGDTRLYGFPIFYFVSGILGPAIIMVYAGLKLSGNHKEG